MFRSRLIKFVLILTMGVGIGILVPVLLMQFPLSNSTSHSHLNDVTEELKLPGEPEAVQLDSFPTSTEPEKLYARVQDGILSIVKGSSGEVILSGLQINHWPKDMQTLVTQIEFHSLDEVQSFIDSMSEEL